MSTTLQTNSSLITTRQICYLSHADVASAGVFEFAALRPLMEEVYRVHAGGDFRLPMADYLKYPGRPSYDRIIALLGYLGGPFQVSGLKQICSSTGNRALGFDRASGLIILNDVQTQRPYAILEAAQISAARTTAVTALAIEWLAPADIRKVAFIGCGYLASVHAIMWRQLYASRCDELVVHDARPDAAESFARRVREEQDLAVSVVGTPEEAMRDADVVIPLTTAEEPYLRAEWWKPGSLYAAVSLLDPELDVLRKAGVIVVDDERLCKHEGRPLQRLEQAGELSEDKVITIGELVSGRRTIARRPEDRVFFNPMGTVLTDLAVALHVLREARSDRHGHTLPV